MPHCEQTNDNTVDVGGGSSGQVFCRCPRLLKPVCGIDGKTYPNSCEAACRKVKYTDGVCKTTPPSGMGDDGDDKDGYGKY